MQTFTGMWMYLIFSYDCIGRRGTGKETARRIDYIGWAVRRHASAKWRTLFRGKRWSIISIEIELHKKYLCRLPLITVHPHLCERISLLSPRLPLCLSHTHPLFPSLSLFTQIYFIRIPIKYELSINFHEIPSNGALNNIQCIGDKLCRETIFFLKI